MQKDNGQDSPETSFSEGTVRWTDWKQYNKSGTADEGDSA